MYQMGSQAPLIAILFHIGHSVGIIFALLFIFKVFEISVALNADLRIQRPEMLTFQLLWSVVLQNATQFTLNQNLTLL